MLHWLEKHNITPCFISIGILFFVVTAPWLVFIIVYGPSLAVQRFRNRGRRGAEAELVEEKEGGEMRVEQVV